MANIHHWTHSLPEGKRIFSTQVESIDLKKMRVVQICNELRSLENEIIEAEKGLVFEAEKQYSSDEITNALIDYMKAFMSTTNHQKIEKP